MSFRGIAKRGGSNFLYEKLFGGFLYFFLKNPRRTFFVRDGFVTQFTPLATRLMIFKVGISIDNKTNKMNTHFLLQVIKQWRKLFVYHWRWTACRCNVWSVEHRFQQFYAQIFSLYKYLNKFLLCASMTSICTETLVLKLKVIDFHCRFWILYGRLLNFLRKIGIHFQKFQIISKFARYFSILGTKWHFLDKNYWNLVIFGLKSKEHLPKLFKKQEAETKNRWQSSEELSKKGYPKK